MADPLPSLFSLSIQESPVLAGGKRAVRMGNTLYVSPAMFDLMRHANPEELRRLMESIEMIDIPKPPSLYDPLPMTTHWRS